MTLFWGGVLSQHEHGLPPFLVELLEEDERSLVQAQTALLVPVDDVQGVLPPIGCDVVFLERHGQDLVAGVVDGHAEGLEYLDLGVRRGGLLRARRGLHVVGSGAAGERRVAVAVTVAVAVAVVGGGGWGGAAQGAGRGEPGSGTGLVGIGPALGAVVVLVAPRYLGAGVLGAALALIVCGRGGRGLGNGVGGHLRAGAQGCCEV